MAMIKPHFMVVDTVGVMGTLANGVEDEQYRRIAMTGSTHSEASLRKWVERVWRVKPKAPLSDVISAAAKGGWVVYQTPGIPFKDDPMASEDVLTPMPTL